MLPTERAEARDPLSLATPDRALADALARLYDVDLLEDPGDLDLYLAVASRAEGPVLELAAGSGRLAIPLAVGGHDVTALDLDPAMLARARRRADAAAPAIEAAGGRIELVEGDMRSWRPTAARFGLAILALNSIMLLATRDQQAAALETMASALAPGGLAVVDVWLPSPTELARYDGTIGLEYVREDPETHNVVVKTASAEHEVATGCVRLTTIFEEGPQGEPARRWVRQDVLRLVAPDELRAMAIEAGLSIEVMAGDYELEPIGKHDDRAILVARRGTRRRSRGLV